MGATNSTHDLTANERTAAIAADAAGAATGSTSISGDEQTALTLLWEGLRGRGVRRPLQLLVEAYDRPEEVKSFDTALLVANGGTLG